MLNALVLASRDAASGSLSDDAQRAFDNMWALQLKTGDLNGAWAWLDFHYEPWEAERSPYFGASLAAAAVGLAPAGYAATPDIQDRLKLLRTGVRPCPRSLFRPEHDHRIDPRRAARRHDARKRGDHDQRQRSGRERRRIVRRHAEEQ